MSQKHTSMADLIAAFDRAHRLDTRANIFERMVLLAMSHEETRRLAIRAFAPTRWQRVKRKIANKIRAVHARFNPCTTPPSVAR